MTSFWITRTGARRSLAAIGLVLALAAPLTAGATPLRAHVATAASGARKPSVSTGLVGHVTGTSAVLEGAVNPHTLATTYWFEYGPTTAYTEKTPTGRLEGGSAAIKVSETATGILPGYHYRLVASNSDGPAKPGRDRIFTVKTTKKKTQFVLPKSFAPTPLGGTFVLAGALTGSDNAARQVVLQASPYPYTGPYVDVGAPVLTSPTGAFSFRVPNMSTSTRFRVSTVAPQAIILSEVIPEQVMIRVILKVRSIARSNGLVRFYGTVTPAEVGAHVFLQLEKAAKARIEKPGKSKKIGKSERPEVDERPPTFSTEFTGRVKRATTSISRFSIVVKVRNAGHYRAFVEVSPGALVSGTSSSVLVHAPAKKAKHKKKS